MTFWHWSSVTPYTSSCEFAGSCVFGKQLPGKLSLRPQTIASRGRALFRRYGRFFAEFLGVLSFVRLALLELHTCVGLRYGRTHSKFRSFSWKTLHDSPCGIAAAVPHVFACAWRIYLPSIATNADANPIRRRHLYSPSLHHLCAGWGILTPCPSPATFVIGLGPTNPSLITIEKETLCFRRAGISPALRLLVLAFSLHYAPLWVTPLASSRSGRSLTTCKARRPHTSSVSVYV